MRKKVAANDTVVGPCTIDVKAVAAGFTVEVVATCSCGRFNLRAEALEAFTDLRIGAADHLHIRAEDLHLEALLLKEVHRAAEEVAAHAGRSMVANDDHVWWLTGVVQIGHRNLQAYACPCGAEEVIEA